MPMTMRDARPPAQPLCALLLLVIICVPAQRASAANKPASLTATEAKILVYISPVGQSLREQGFDVGMERQTSSQLDQANYYYFWIYDSKRQQLSGSVTVGYYAVNKHTGQVWDTETRKEVSSGLMKGVQAIIRRSHGIDESTLAKYSNRQF